MTIAPLRTPGSLLLLLLLTTALLPLGPGKARAEIEPVFDTSAVEAFWPLVELLREDLEPPVEMWDAMLETPALEALAEQGMSPLFFERLMNLAFRPSMAQARNTALGDQRIGPSLQHFLEVWERREELDRAMRGMVRTGIDPELLAGLRALLPAEIPSGRPPVAFAVFANAGRGGDPLVVDPLALVSWDVPPYLTHEMHHWYRDQLLEYEPDAVQPADRDLVAWLDALQAEGVADLLDKKAWMENPLQVDPDRKPYVDQYLHAIDHVEESIEALDAALSVWNLAESAAERRGATNELGQKMPLGGHPVGYHMVTTITGVFGTQGLRDTVGNPFAFARLYDEAARRGDRARPLSDEAMAALGRLEERYATAGGDGR